MDPNPLNLRALQPPRGSGGSSTGRSPAFTARLAHVLAAALALGIAAYLTNEKWQGRITNLAGCGGEEGCSQLLGGRWANWLLVPVSFWALTVYAPLLVLGLLGITTRRRLQLAWIGSGILAAAALWFLGVQLFVEHRFCKYCFAMHTCSVVLLATTAAHARQLGRVSRETRATSPTGAQAADRLPTARIAWIAGVSAALALVAGQLFGPQPATHQLTETTGITPAMNAAPPEPSANAGPAAHAEPAANEAATTNDATAAKPAPSGGGPSGGGPSGTGSSDSGSRNTRPANTNPVPSGDELPDLPDEKTPLAVETNQGNPRPASSLAPSPATTTSASASRSLDKGPVQTTPPKADTAADTATNSAADGPDHQPRPLRFLDGALVFDLHEMPHVGSTQASSVIVKYFDYTCKSCRTMHGELEAVQKQHPGQLAVVMLPCPLDRNCNPAAPPGNAHRDACVYARLALAVWRADRRQFAAFHDELFQLQGNLTPAIARRKAVELVGEAGLSRAEQDPWVGKTLDKTISIYRIMARQNPRMPKVVLGGTVILHGVTVSQNDLVGALEKYAGLKKAAAGNP